MLLGPVVILGKLRNAATVAVDQLRRRIAAGQRIDQPLDR